MNSYNQWNSSVSWYDQNMGENGDTLNKEIIFPALLEMIGNVTGKKILDSGCGSGYVSAYIAEKAQSVMGTDFANGFVELCKKKYEAKSNLSFQQQDITKPMSFDDASFDVVISKMVLQYVPTISTFTKESFRILKKDGKLIVIVDHPFNTQFYYAQQIVGKPNQKYTELKDYFNKNEQTKLSLWGKIELTWYPRTVSDYIQAFIKEKFILSEMRELPEVVNGIPVPRILILQFSK